MEEMKLVIAKNIATLRQSNHMTQLELAEKLNYSDKAISKWERGESIPDVLVLKNIADLFGVTLEYLLEAEHQQPAAPEHEPAPEPVAPKGHPHIHNRSVVTWLSILLVWFTATFAFIMMDIFVPLRYGTWLAFVCAVPVSMVVWLVFNSVWFNKRRNYLIISLLMWSTLAAFFITASVAGHPVWKFFLLGIPGQIAIILWSRFRSKSNHA